MLTFRELLWNSEEVLVSSGLVHSECKNMVHILKRMNLSLCFPDENRVRQTVVKSSLVSGQGIFQPLCFDVFRAHVHHVPWLQRWCCSGWDSAIDNHRQKSVQSSENCPGNKLALTKHWMRKSWVPVTPLHAQSAFWLLAEARWHCSAVLPACEPWQKESSLENSGWNRIIGVKGRYRWSLSLMVGSTFAKVKAVYIQ